jgi:FtsZ-interacting cell division protein YlmF
MAKRKAESKISNILDSYVEFKDMDDEVFRKTFGGPKNTIINSWLFLLYLDLKEHFESQEEEDEEDERAEPAKTKKKRQSARRRTKPSVAKVTETAESDEQNDEKADQKQDTDEDIFGLNKES